MKGWKVKIPGLEDYEKIGFEFYEDVDFLYIYHDSYSPSEPVGIFSKGARIRNIKGFLDGYMAGDLFNSYIDEGVDLV